MDPKASVLPTIPQRPTNIYIGYVTNDLCSNIMLRAMHLSLAAEYHISEECFSLSSFNQRSRSNGNSSELSRSLRFLFSSNHHARCLFRIFPFFPLTIKLLFRSFAPCGMSVSIFPEQLPSPPSRLLIANDWSPISSTPCNSLPSNQPHRTRQLCFARNPSMRRRRNAFHPADSERFTESATNARGNG